MRYNKAQYVIIRQIPLVMREENEANEGNN